MASSWLVETRPVALVVLRLMRAVSVATATLMAVLAVTFLARRLAGALHSPLPSLVLVATALAGAAVAIAARLVYLGGTRGSRLAASWCGLLPSLSLVLFGAAFSLPESSLWGLAVFWLVAARAPAALLLSRRWVPNSTDPPDSPGAPRSAIEQDPASPSPPLPAEDEEGELLPPGVVQQITRSADERGRETVCGLLRANLSPGERTHVLHVAFCPPLSDVPGMTLHQLDGPPSRLKTTEVQVYGARIEVRMPSPPDQPTSLILQFEATEG